MQLKDLTHILIFQAVYFIRPAHCNHFNCNHIVFSASSKLQWTLAQDLKHLVVTVAVVTVCRSYEC